MMQRSVAYDRAYRVAVGDLTVSSQRRRGRYHDLGERRPYRNDSSAYYDLGNVKTVGGPRSAVHEPVAALDKEYEPEYKKQNRYQH